MGKFRRIKLKSARSSVCEFCFLAYYWAGRLQLPFFKIFGFKGIKFPCFTLKNFKGEFEIWINPYYLRNISRSTLLSYLLHELGHIKYDLPYETTEQQIRSEYLAEKFALRIMKKFYPKEYKQYLNKIRREVRRWSRKWKEHYDIHYKAFMKIKEYKDALRQ